MKFAAEMGERFGHRSCLVTPEGTILTYSDVADKADALFSDVNGRKRCLVFILAGNELATIISYLGALRAGHAVHILGSANASDNANLIQKYRPEILVDCAGAVPELRLDSEGERPLDPDIAVLLSTSGTTGASKFVKLTRMNIESNTEAIVDYLSITANDRGVTTLRPYYSYGMSVINSHIAAGASLLVTQLGVTQREFWSDIRKFDVTNIPGVPYTYELIDEMGVQLEDYPSLRFLTQAGGKLSPTLVADFARRAKRANVDFYVMYGQTEASPRISYLPPERAMDAPDSIGWAIPGGRLELRDDDDAIVTVPGEIGELTYYGPNVMAGYASERSELGSLQLIEGLRTGDLAKVDAGGLYYIVGRKSRFVKPFGQRVALDEVETFVKDLWGPSAVCGDDRHVVIHIEAVVSSEIVRQTLSVHYRLPLSVFVVQAGNLLPRLSNGKPDYRQMIASATATQPDGRLHKVAGRIFNEFTAILLGRTQKPISVLDAFLTVFGQRQLDENSSFASLGGDSLSYLQMHLLLEECLPSVPADWITQSIRSLENVSRPAL